MPAGSFRLYFLLASMPTGMAAAYAAEKN